MDGQLRGLCRESAGRAVVEPSDPGERCGERGIVANQGSARLTRTRPDDAVASPPACTRRHRGGIVDIEDRIGDVVQALRRILAQAPSSSVRTDAGVAAGSAAQSGSRSRTLTSVSDIVSPSNARRPVSIS